MVVLDEYRDVEGSSAEGHTSDAPPSYETITAFTHSSTPDRPVGEKRSSSLYTTSVTGSNSHGPISGSVSSSSTSRQSHPNRSWLSMLTTTTTAPSSRTSKQVQQTVLALIRDLVLTVESPDLLSSCADACRTYGLDLSALLQQPSIEGHSAIYWAVLNRREALLQSLLVHAAPLSKESVSEIRLACIATPNQALFQALRCWREPFTRQMTPLSKCPGSDALLLGDMPADEVSIRVMEGYQGAFAADIRMNLWQKRMRVSGRVSVEFIARGRIWSLTFFSPQTTTRATTEGVWKVALCLMEHSPPSFVDARLVVDLPSPQLSSSSNVSTSTHDLISTSPTATHPSSRSISRSSTPSDWLTSKFRSTPGDHLEIRLNSNYRLAYRPSDTFLPVLDAEYSGQNRWGDPPRVERWTDENKCKYVNAIIGSLCDGDGAELMYDNTTFVEADGTLCVRLEAQLAKPDDKDCVIC